MDAATILIVDDEPANLQLLAGLLRPEFVVCAANSGEGALRVAASDPKPDLAQLVSIRALAHLAETRDLETGGHILRTQGSVQHMAVGQRDHPRFATLMKQRCIDLLVRSAPLHDIGKVGTRSRAAQTRQAHCR